MDSSTMTPGPSPGDKSSISDAPQTSYRFTTEEMRVLRQCNKESFYQRSLPLSTALSVGTYFAVKSGYLKSHPRFGPTPKVLVAATIGYFIGKVSYQAKCAEKLMQLPNSPIGEMLRQRKKQGGMQETISDHTGLPWTEIPSMNETAQNMETDRPVSDELHDSFRPTVDSPATEEEGSVPHSQHSASYEELRQRNRDEFDKRGRTIHRVSTSSDDHTTPQIIHRVEESLSDKIRGKNKYGDIWEE